jgi:hypothetical protein
MFMPMTEAARAHGVTRLLMMQLLAQALPMLWGKFSAHL